MKNCVENFFTLNLNKLDSLQSKEKEDKKMEIKMNRKRTYTHIIMNAQ